LACCRACCKTKPGPNWTKGRLRRGADAAAPASHRETPRKNSPVAAGCSRSSDVTHVRSEEHTSELQSLMRISYAVFCLKKKIKKNNHITNSTHRSPHSQ